MRHSLWEQDTLEAYNELLFGNLDAEVEAVQQRRAAYDEERRLSEGSDACRSGAYSDPDNATYTEVVLVDILTGPLEGDSGHKSEAFLYNLR